MDSHYISLLAAYVVAVILWILINHFFPVIWKKEKKEYFKKPAFELLFSFMVVIAILGIGQLYIQKMLIPSKNSIALDAVNQFIIFSPTILLVIIRKQSFETLWLPSSRIILRIIIGLLLAICSVFMYWLVRSNANSFQEILLNIYHYKNASHLVQVFMEDITIALIFVRLSSCIGNKWSIGIVALLFAAAHIPSFIANGATLLELSSLLLDMGLGVIVLLALSRSRDVWWFVMVHFALDMTQFYG